MGQPLSLDLRVRLLAAIDAGMSCRAAAARCEHVSNGTPFKNIVNDCFLSPMSFLAGVILRAKFDPLKSGYFVIFIAG